MYPRNATTPPRICLGPVVQISDGAVQTSGVSVVVRAEGGSETAGGGTVSYGASSNCVYYAPTQAETNYTAFVVTAYKTGCIPVSVTVITTASATSGTALLAPVTHTSAVVPTVTTLTNLPAISAGWLTAAGIAASALNGKGDWNIGKTGYTLTQAFPANFAALDVSAGGDVAIQTNLKVGQALSGFPVLMTDSTNHDPVTGLTVAVSYSHDEGSTWIGLGTATETADGFYSIDLTTAAMNNAVVLIKATATGADQYSERLILEP